MKQIVIQGYEKQQAKSIKCSKIIMGSADFLRADNLEVAGRILDDYVASGGNTFDTARHYRHSENALGLWMEARKNRSAVNIETKCCHPIRGALDVPRVTPAAIEEDLMTSLAQLKTDHVEMLALHRDDPTVPVGPIMEALHRQVEKGLVYAIGVSNWELPRIQEAQQYCQQHHLTPLSFNSPNLSLATINKPRWENCVTADTAMQSWHQKIQLPLLAWSSQAEGFFASRFSPDDQSNTDIVDVYYNDQNWEKLARVNWLAKNRGVKPIQISLAYVLNQPFPICAVIGSETQAELDTSVVAAGIQLSANELAWLALEQDNLPS